MRVPAPLTIALTLLAALPVVASAQDIAPVLSDRFARTAVLTPLLPHAPDHDARPGAAIPRGGEMAIGPREVIGPREDFGGILGAVVGGAAGVWIACGMGACAGDYIGPPPGAILGALIGIPVGALLARSLLD